jgi:hypothetical protein
MKLPLVNGVQGDKFDTELVYSRRNSFIATQNRKLGFWFMFLINRIEKLHFKFKMVALHLFRTILMITSFQGYFISYVQNDIGMHE